MKHAKRDPIVSSTKLQEQFLKKHVQRDTSVKTKEWTHLRPATLEVIKTKKARLAVRPVLLAIIVIFKGWKLLLSARQAILV